MLFAAGILTACQADYNEPQPGPDAPGEALGLTVSACDMVVTGGASSRVADSGSATVFNVGDTVGLTIIDDKDELVIDNVPYELYNSLDEEGNVTGRYWGIDVEKAGGLEQIFYDRTMKTYIVYYPYDKSVTGCKSISEIQYLEVFDIRENQREELDYRFSDLMACTGNVTPQISADLEHLRNCFCLDPKMRCTLNNGETITYRPKRYLFSADAYSAPRYECETTGFEEFKIEKIGKDTITLIDYDIDDNPKDTGILYIAEDGSYRYILPKTEEATFKWRYFYRGKTYGGKYTIEPPVGEESQSAGKRFMFDETTDLGAFSPYLQVNDYFCSKNGVGYPFPWEAAVDLLDEHPCIGVIFRVGLNGNPKNPNDNGYELSGVYNESVYANEDHGYVVALTDAPDENLSFKKLQWRTTGENKLIGPLSQNMDTYAYWSGYKYLSAIREYVEDDAVGWRNFPAAYACEQYGNRIPEMTAPGNTSGWFLPTMYQLAYISGYRGPNYSKVDGANESNSFITRNHILTQRIATVNRKLPASGYKEHVKLYYPSTEQLSAAHWGSEIYNETIQYDKDTGKETGRTYIFTQAEVQNLMGKDTNSPEQTKTASNYVRAVLAF